MTEPMFEAEARVTIVGVDHPWRGYSGVIVGPFSGHLDWIVELDVGQQTAVHEKDLVRDA